MPNIVIIFSKYLFRVFNILITLMSVMACSTAPPATVYDRSGSAIKRPQAHVVIAGDTLFSIAWRYGLKYEALANHNKIKPPYIIRPSQVIRLDVSGYPSSFTPAKPVVLKNGVAVESGYNKRPVTVSQSAAIRKEKRTNKPAGQTALKHVWSAPEWRWPVKGAVLSGFESNSGLNKGIDIGGKLGEPVLAAASGQVVYSGSGLRGYGKLLIVKHNETFLSAYAHNNSLKVKEGDLVKAGQLIADMGSSGTDRVKLHFEIRRDGTPVDPLRFLPRR